MGEFVCGSVSIGQIMDATKVVSRTRDVWGRGRSKGLTEWRFIAWHVMIETGFAYASIGYRCGRDHTSIIHGVKRARAMLEFDKGWRTKRDALMAEIARTPTPRDRVVALALAEHVRLQEAVARMESMQAMEMEVMQQAA